MTVVGSAEVVVRAITTKVKSDIQKAFADARPMIQREGRNAGLDFAHGFGDAIQKTLTPEITNAMNNAADNAALSAGRRLADGIRGNTRDLSGAIRDSLNGTEGDADAAGDGAGRGFSRGFRRGMGDFDNSLASAGNALMNLIAMGNIAGAAISGLVSAVSAAASGLFAMAAAASQAAGALMALPGLLAAIGQGAGIARLAFGGIGEALKANTALEKAQTAATSGLTAAKTRQAAAADAVRAAQERLNKAREDAKKKIEALSKATEEASKRANAAETKEAEAAERLDRLQQSGTASAAQIAKAEKALADAKKQSMGLRVKEQNAIERERKAKEKGISGDKKVIAAEKALEAARKKQQAATAAGAGPIAKVAQAQNAFNQAMADLSPAAQEFVKQLISMKSTLAEFREIAQENFFPPLTQGFRDLNSGLLAEGTRGFDSLKESTARTADAMGTMSGSLLSFISTGQGLTRTQRIFQGNADILAVFNKEARDLDPNSKSSRTAMESLALAAQNILIAIQPLTQRFAEWIAVLINGATESDGMLGSISKMTDFFNSAGDTAAQLGDIFGNLIGIIGNVGGASKESGQTLLDSFEEATAKLEEFTSTDPAQSAMGAYFDGVADNLRALGDMIVIIGDEFFKLGDNPGIAAFATSIEPAIRNIGEMFDIMTRSGGSFAEMINNVTALAAAFMDLEGMQAFFWLVGAIAGAFAKLLELPIISDIAKITAMFVGAKVAIGIALKTLGFFTAGFFGLNDALKETAQEFVGTFTKKVSGSIDTLWRKITRRPPRTPTPDAGADPISDTNRDAEAADALKDGEKIGESLALGIAVGIENGKALISEAIDSVTDAIHANARAGAELMDEIGHDFVRGLIEGLKKSPAELNAVVQDLGEAVIKALKDALGVKSPSVIADDIGENVGLGLVNGIRGMTDEAFDAGRDLAQAAQTGAESAGVISPNVAPGAASGATSAASGAADSAAAPALATIGTVTADLDAKNTKAAKSTGILGKAFSGLGKGIKSLTGGMLGLVGGPMGALMIATPFLVAGFKKLYDSSPALQQFISTLRDGLQSIWESIQPVVQAVGGVLLTAFNAMFSWINSKMPAISAFFSDAFGVIAGFIQNNVVPVFQDYLVPAMETMWETFQSILPALKDAFMTVFEAMSGIVRDVLVPVWTSLLLPAISKGISVFKTVAPVILKVVAAILPFIASLIRIAATIVRTVIPVVVKIISLWASAWGSAISKAISMVVKIISTIIRFGSVIVGAVGQVLKFVAGIVRGIARVVKIFISLPGKIMSAVRSISGKLSNFFGEVFDKVMSKVGKGIDRVKDAFSELPGKLLESLKDMKDAGKDLIGAIFDGMTSFGGMVKDFATDLASGVKGAINDILDLPLKVGPLSVRGFEIMGEKTLIPEFAKGVRNFSGGLALVGEQGPELVTLPKGSNVFTASQTRNMVRNLNSGDVSSVVNNANRTSRNLSNRSGDTIINVYNPVPERASESTASALRRKTFNRGWN